MNIKGQLTIIHVQDTILGKNQDNRVVWFSSHQKNFSLSPSLHNYKTTCISQISSAFQSPTTPFPISHQNS